MHMQSSQLEYKKYLYLVKRRWGLFVVLALFIMTAVFVLSYLLPRKYEATSTVYIGKNLVTELVRGITVTPSLEDTINAVTYAITSKALFTKVVDSLDLNPHDKSQPKKLIDRLQRGVTVKVKDKNHFTISFVDENPLIARDVVNTLVRLYIQENISFKTGETSDATNFLSTQVAAVNSKLEKAEADIKAFKREKGGMISIDEARLFEETNLAQQRLYDLQLRRRQLEGMRRVTRNGNDVAQSRLVLLQNKLDELRRQYTDSYPEVVSVKGEIEAVKEQLQTRRGASTPLDPQELARIDSEIDAIKVTEEGLRRSVNTNRNILQSVPSAKSGLEALETEQKNQKDVYDQLLARYRQSELSKQMEVQDKSTTFRVLDPATLPVKPISPDRLKIMLLGIIGSVAASFGSLVMLDKMDDSVKEIESVKGFGLPLLAIIPRIEEPETSARRRRRFVQLSAAAAIYFLVMLCFPAMELLRLPYMDQLLDQFFSGSQTESVKGATR